MKVAISGFRHGHVVGMTRLIREHPDLEIVAVAEEDPQACADYLSRADVAVTHPDFDSVIRGVDFDILAVGDVYAKRGRQVIRALEAGKHVISDKPLCTRLDECGRIRDLARAHGLAVFVWLSLRYEPAWQTARRLILAGQIGEVVSVYAAGPHRLAYRAGRPDWYFAPGQHGGIINDLMIHAVDATGWLTGQPIVEIVAARAWNAGLPQVPFFQDASQALLRLGNDAGVVLDCCYKAVAGHAAPWVFDIWGATGRLRLHGGAGIALQLPDEPQQRIEATPDSAATPIAEFVAEIAGRSSAAPVLTTEESLESSRQALLVQQAADEGRTHVTV